MIETSPERAAESLRLIEQAARSGLRDMRGLLAALGGEDENGLAPLPGLDAIAELVDGARAAGLDVELREEGRRGDLAPGTGTTLYRILQEALTNAARHGADGRTTVELRWRDDAVELEVANPVGGMPEGSDGRGLVGMRERAALVGGELSAEARDGSFRVRARLPREEVSP